MANNTFLCASCGAEVRMDYMAPGFGLCEECEAKIQQADSAWQQKEDEKHER